MNHHYAVVDDQGNIVRIERGYHRKLPCAADVLDTTHYEAGGEILEKQPFDTTHDVSGLEVVFTALPAGTLISVEGQTLIGDGLGDVIEFELPGTYSIRLSGSAPHLDETLEVTVG